MQFHPFLRITLLGGFRIIGVCISRRDDIMDNETIRLSAGRTYSDASPANFALFMSDATQYLNDKYAKEHDKIFGIEIKSRNDDTWKTNGGSVQETQRIEEVERIFLTFGNFGKNPVVFKSRPYEDVISNISVTHSPRYDIDMMLDANDTIFDKMGIPYDDFRKIEPDPAREYVKYRRRNLKPGESTWWLSEEDADNISPDVIKAWDKSLSVEEKTKTIAEGMVLYPAVFNADYIRVN
jgi:hypothetical protein